MKQILYSGNMYSYPYPGIPETWSLEAQAEARRVLTSLELLGLGFPTEREGDVEDFWENALRADAALLASRKHGLPISQLEKPDWSAAELARRIGPVSVREESRHGNDPLATHPILVEHGGS